MRPFKTTGNLPPVTHLRQASASRRPVPAPASQQPIVHVLWKFARGEGSTSFVNKTFVAGPHGSFSLRDRLFSPDRRWRRAEPDQLRLAGPLRLGHAPPRLGVLPARSVALPPRRHDQLPRPRRLVVRLLRFDP